MYCALTSREDNLFFQTQLVSSSTVSRRGKSVSLQQTELNSWSCEWASVACCSFAIYQHSLNWNEMIALPLEWQFMVIDVVACPGNVTRPDFLSDKAWGINCAVIITIKVHSFEIFLYFIRLLRKKLSTKLSVLNP